MGNHLHNTPSGAVSLDLPVLNGGLFPTQRREAAEPEHAGAKVGLRPAVVEEDSSLAAERSRVECVVHEQEYVYIVWHWLSGDEGTGDHESGKVSRLIRQAMDPFEPVCDCATPAVSVPKSSQHLGKSRSVDIHRQVASIVELWERRHAQKYRNGAEAAGPRKRLVRPNVIPVG